MLLRFSIYLPDRQLAEMIWILLAEALVAGSAEPLDYAPPASAIPLLEIAIQWRIPGYILQLEVTHMDGLKPGVIADIFKNALGDIHAPRLADRLDTCSHIEAVTKGIGAVITDISDVDTNPHRHFRIFLVFNLHLYRTLHRIDAAVKNAEGAIPKKLEHLTSVFLMQGEQDALYALT